MRQAGNIASSQDAQRLTAYLITQGIAAQADQEGQQWVIWVRDEDQVPRAKEELARYQAEPQNARYEGVEKAAAEKLREEAKRRSQVQKNIRSPADRWSNEKVTAGPLTHAVILLCGMVFLLTGFGKEQDNSVGRSLSFVDASSVHRSGGVSNEALENQSPLASIKRGEVWRLITPIFLHAGFLHILFNMMMFHMLGSLVESRRGTAVLAGLIVGLAIVSNLGQALMPIEWGGNANFCGISGVVYGLLGYCWMKTRYEPTLGIRIGGEVVFFLLVWMALLWIKDIANIDSQRTANWAHLYGFVAGIAIGIAPALFRQARTRS